MKKKHIFFAGRIFGALLFILAVSAAHAQTPPSGGTGGGGTPPNGGTGVGVPIPSFFGACDTDPQPVVCILNKIFDAISIIAIPILAIMILIGGIQLMTSRGDVEGITKGRKTITYAVIGLVAILLASSVYPVIKSIFQ